MQLCKTEILLVALSHEHSTRTSFLKWLVKRSYFPQPLGPAQCPSLTKTKESPLPGSTEEGHHTFRGGSLHRAQAGCQFGGTTTRFAPSTCLSSENDDGQTFERFFFHFLDCCWIRCNKILLLGCWLFCAGRVDGSRLLFSPQILWKSS